MFGKPVTQGTWRVVRESSRNWNYEKQTWETVEGAAVEGSLDADGKVSAEIDISEAAERLRENNYERFVDLTFAAYVTDSTTNRTEQKRFDVRVSREPIHVYVIGQEDTVNPALPIDFFVTTFYADGSPAACDVEISGGYIKNQVKTGDEKADEAEYERLYQQALSTQNLARVKTDRYGAGRVSFAAPSFDATEEELFLHVKARAKDGKTGFINERQSLDREEEMLRLTPRRAIIKSGSPIELDIVSTRSEGIVYIDIERRFANVASSFARLQNGRASLKIPYNSKFRNDLSIKAYVTYIDKDEDWETIRDSAAVIYPRSENLSLTAEVSKTSFRPNEDGTIKFDVLTSSKKREETALGVVVFDKAIEERARTDREFGGGSGGDNSFFGSLNGLLAEAGFGGVTLGDINQLQPKDFTPELDLAARLILDRRYRYFYPNFFGGDYYSANIYSTFRKFFEQQFAPLDKVLREKYISDLKAVKNLEDLTESSGNIDVTALRDPWENPYRVEFETKKENIELRFITAGADEVFDTKDDFTAHTQTFNYFQRVGKMIDSAVNDFNEKTGQYVRDEATLRRVLAEKGISAEDLRDNWNRPLKFEFDIVNENYVIRWQSAGANGKFEKIKPYDYNLADDFFIWETRTDYYAVERLKIEKVLNEYLKQGKDFPQNLEQLKSAFAAAGIALESLRDIYGRPLNFDFYRKSRFADHLTIENVAEYGGKSKEVRRVTPVTQEFLTLYIYSAGADGDIETYIDNFALAVFSVVISEKERTDATPAPESLPKAVLTPKPAASPFVSVEGSGAIRGTVTDSSGVVVPNAKISVSNIEKEKIYTAQTDEYGEYIIKNLPLGLYRIEAESGGFNKSIVNSVVVHSMSLITVDFMLEVGTVSAVVEVAAGILKAVSSGVVSTSDFSVSSTQIRELPINGRKISDSAVAAKPNTALISDDIATPRLREYFPETLVWLPEIVTDKNGRAEVKFKLADNLTTWKMAVIGTTLDGEIGFTTREFQTFMPFFAELEPPKFLTVGDRIALPVPLRNYLDKPQTVTTTFAAQDWFETLGAATQSVNIAPNSSANSIFDFRAVRAVSKGRQRVTAVSANRREAADAIEKTLDVRPYGREVTATNGAVFRENTTFDVNFSNQALPETPRAEIKIYPNLTAHIAESIEGVLRRPDGCGEQTTSSAYPNLIYLQLTGENGDAAQKAKALENLRFGYTRLLAYQKTNGGFGYWANDGETDLALTAYAARFLTEAGEFIEVDDAVIRRAKQFLRSAQRADGSWTKIYASEKTEDSRRTAILTAYIARNLAQASTAKDAETIKSVKNALDYLQTKTPQFADEPYSLATYALASLAVGEREKALSIAQSLTKLAKREGTGAFWNLETNTPFYGWGLPARIETTALVIQVFERLNNLSTAKNAEFSDLTNKGLLFLLKNKDRYGVWFSSQTTVNVLGAIVEVSRESALENSGTDAKNFAVVSVNGRDVRTIELPAYKSISNPIIIDVSPYLQSANNRVEIRQNGTPRTATANVVQSHYVAWTETGVVGARVNDSDGLRLKVDFDQTQGSVLKEVSCRVEAERVGFRGYGMLLAEIGLPPGADVDRASLEEILKANQAVSRYDVLPDRIIFYLWAKAGGSKFSFKFKPRFALTAHSAPSQIYDYYNPEANAVLAPSLFNVR